MGTNISPSATTLASPTSTPSTASSSSSTNPAKTTSSSPYFLPELIPSIESRLTSLRDFFALRAACRTYRALLTPSPDNLASQDPLLLVPLNASASKALLHAPLRQIPNLCHPRTHLDGLDIHDPFGLHTFGCRIAIHDPCNCNTLVGRRELRISHLVTGERARLPDHPKDIDGVIYSGDLVITFKGFRPALYYCRIGDLQWREALCDEGNLFYSLVLVKGTLYGLIYPNYHLAMVELHNDSAQLSFLGDEWTSQFFQDYSLFSLAECRGELLLVVAVEHSPLVYHVFQWQSGETEWARITSLGGCSLFFHRHQFAGCLGPDHPTVRRDCLYFTWFSGQWCEYCLFDGSLKKHVADYPGRGAEEDHVPLSWVLPSIG
uniref:Uncharacterized protein n=1 Tax=Avena sativa TaxID=4498 RepID=A0ACD5XKH7_AVESA